MEDTFLMMKMIATQRLTVNFISVIQSTVAQRKSNAKDTL